MSVKKQVIARYKVNLKARMANALISFLLKLGVRVGSTALLTVKGRKTGVPRTNPVLIVGYDGHRYLVSAYGEVSWVRNIRASQNAKLFYNRKTEVISVAEISPLEAAPVLKYILKFYPSTVRSYFSAEPNSSIELFQEDALRHPVFEIK